jgi:BirA family transcriptional regulator, biotin operon repressor / biotin---[acetyl-CoA-carboxylase] ligase
MYSKEELTHGLTTQVFGRIVLVYDSIDSTNTCAKDFAAKGAGEGTVVIADHQTAGHGRFGRIWQAESGLNLLFTLIIRPALRMNKIGLLPFFAAVGIALTIENVAGIKCECKWPNDILCHGKKCCGILMESAVQKGKLDYAIIGIGLNVNQKNFIDGLNSRATSLSNECGREFDRKDIFCQTMSSLESLYQQVSKGDFTDVIREWKARTTIFGKRIKLTIADDVIQGVALGLASDGGLVVETKSRQRVFYAGDVTLINEI